MEGNIHRKKRLKAKKNSGSLLLTCNPLTQGTEANTEYLSHVILAHLGDCILFMLKFWDV